MIWDTVAHLGSTLEIHSFPARLTLDGSMVFCDNPKARGPMMHCGFADADARISQLKTLYPDRFPEPGAIFGHIKRGDRIFVATGCAEPRHLSRSFLDHARANPKAFFDAELSHLVALGLTGEPLDDFRPNFRQHFFFVAHSTRDAVTRGLADYTPSAMSQVSRLIKRGLMPVDVAFIQVSPPGSSGRLSLGVSVDVMKEVMENSRLVIAQVNAFMPYTHGDSTIDPEQVDFFIHHDEPLVEFHYPPPDDVTRAIGSYVARLVPDGSTIQAGYGRVVNAVLEGLGTKRHLGVHTEMLSSGIIDLMRAGVVDNAKKSADALKTVASLCLGTSDMFAFMHDNPAIAFMPSSYTNDPSVIARQERMVAINSALQIDLTGQASSESFGPGFYSGIGGDVDFMRAVSASPSGRTILAMPSTAKGGAVSRIVARLGEGAGVTYNRSDIQYVVTEYGICHLQGKNIRERAMSLVAVAHPRFRPSLVEEAKRLGLVPEDQPFFTGPSGLYPTDVETHRTTRTGLTVFLRPIKISDEELHKKFVYSLSERTLTMRFLSPKTEFPRRERQRLVVIDYTRHMAILALLEGPETEEIVGIARYAVEGDEHKATLAVVVKDDFHNQGIGTVLLDYVTFLARKQGLLGFTAEVFADNRAVMRMLRRMREMGHDVKSSISDGVLSVTITFGHMDRPQRQES